MTPSGFARALHKLGDLIRGLSMIELVGQPYHLHPSAAALPSSVTGILEEIAPQKVTMQSCPLSWTARLSSNALVNHASD